MVLGAARPVHALFFFSSALAVLQLLGVPGGGHCLGDKGHIGSELKCENSVQGKYLLADNRGYVCSRQEVQTSTGCCPIKSDPYTCLGCNLTLQCCDIYEYCVACCLHPGRTKSEIALDTLRADQPSSAKYGSVFEYCRSRCRHNSKSVVHENAYISEWHHCFSLLPPPPPPPPPEDENSLEGLTIVVAAPGQPCTTACAVIDHQGGGSQCNEAKLRALNSCEILQKFFTCKGGCISSMGLDQPAEVLPSAPRHLFPGACLSNSQEVLFSCTGSHQYTRRLCPCSAVTDSSK